MEAPLFVILYVCLEWIMYIICSSPRWIKSSYEGVLSIIQYVFANKTRFLLLLKMLYSLIVILSIVIFTFKRQKAEVPLYQTITMAFFVVIYVVVMICKWYKWHKKMRIQYKNQKRRYYYLGASKNTYETSYVHFILGLLVDEKKFVFWLTNIVFKICAPVSVVAFVYIQFCNIENLIYIVSLVSITLALYSVWKTIDYNRETTKMLRKVMAPIYAKEGSSSQDAYANQEPDNSDSNDWEETL